MNAFRYLSSGIVAIGLGLTTPVWGQETPEGGSQASWINATAGARSANRPGLWVQAGVARSAEFQDDAFTYPDITEVEPEIDLDGQVKVQLIQDFFENLNLALIGFQQVFLASLEDQQAPPDDAGEPIDPDVLDDFFGDLTGDADSEAITSGEDIEEDGIDEEDLLDDEAAMSDEDPTVSDEENLDSGSLDDFFGDLSDEE